jgi:hypothetical protein
MINYIKRFFARDKVSCPRCLGKGKVDLADIKRLKMELYWGEGKCAYCGGSGKVMSSTIETIRPDMAYLTTDIPNAERLRLLNGDENSLKKARNFEAESNGIIKEIEDLYFIGNLEPESIADSFEGKYQITNFVGDQRKAMIDYIDKVIKRRLGSS